MSKRNPRLYLHEILDATDSVAKYIVGLTYAEFLQLRMVRTLQDFY
jgi:uncharacterized protein with HEPN domain